jgi:large subunit ribosomal protein L41
MLVELTGDVQLKPYVSVKVDLTKEEERLPFGRFRGAGGLTPEHFLRVSREHDRLARMGATAFKTLPSWYNSHKNVTGEAPVHVKSSS